jgi:hypothetical protein
MSKEPQTFQQDNPVNSRQGGNLLEVVQSLAVWNLQHRANSPPPQRSFVGCWIKLLKAVPRCQHGRLCSLECLSFLNLRQTNI